MNNFRAMELIVSKILKWKYEPLFSIHGNKKYKFDLPNKKKYTFQGHLGAVFITSMTNDKSR